jgi:hypothetical protein
MCRHSRRPPYPVCAICSGRGEVRATLAEPRASSGVSRGARTAEGRRRSSALTLRGRATTSENAAAASVGPSLPAIVASISRLSRTHNAPRFRDPSPADTLPPQGVALRPRGLACRGACGGVAVVGGRSSGATFRNERSRDGGPGRSRFAVRRADLRRSPPVAASFLCATRTVHAVDHAADDRASAGRLVKLSARTRSPLFGPVDSLALLIGPRGARASIRRPGGLIAQRSSTCPSISVARRFRV